MSTLNLHKVNDEVFIARDPIVKIGPADVAFVKAKAAANGRKRARICAHKTIEDTLHEMVIAISAQSYIHPHKHFGKSESFHIIEGTVDVVVFDDDGNVENLVELGDPTTGRVFFYRLSEGTYHTLLIKTDYLVLHEATNGPFSSENTSLAPWAPHENHLFETAEYTKHLAKLVYEHKLAAGNYGI